MPPASSPTRLQILQAAATALRAINGGSTYWHTVKSASVQLDVTTEFLTKPSTELPAFVLEPATVPGERIFEPGRPPIVRDVFEFTVIGRVVVDGGPAAGDRKVTAGEKLAHDVEVALAADIRLGLPTLVIGAFCEQADVSYGEGSDLSVYTRTRVRVTYKRNYGQP
jgi:hypothetical protein